VRRSGEEVARHRRSRREGLRESLTIVVASVAAFAAGAAGLALVRSDDRWESTAVARGGLPGEPLLSAQTARRALAAIGAAGEEAGALLDRLEGSRRAGGEVAFTVSAEEPRPARRLAASYAAAWAGEARARPAGPARRERGTARAAFAGAAVGLLAGLLLALFRERLDVRRTSSRRMAARLGFGQLGRVPEVPDGLEEAYRLPALESPGGTAAGDYERLAAAVAEAAQEASARVMAVSGTVAEDRGEQVAAGLAAALAVDGRTVAVAELDPARPTLRRLFALARRVGAAEVARGEAGLDAALAGVQGVSGLSVLSAGAGPAPGGEAAAAVLGALRERFDVVVVAGPPLLEEGGAQPPGIETVVIPVVLRRTRHSRRPRLERVVGDLGVPVLGYVLVASGDDSPRVARLSEARA